MLSRFEAAGVWQTWNHQVGYRLCDRRSVCGDGRAGALLCLRLELLAIPVHRQFETFLNAMGWRIAKQLPRFLNVRVRMADVARSELAVNRLLFRKQRIELVQCVLNQMK